MKFPPNPPEAAVDLDVGAGHARAIMVAGMARSSLKGKPAFFFAGPHKKT